MTRDMGVLLVMTRAASGHAGPVATWISAAGWAEAARRRFGNSWIRAPEGILTPEEARALATRPSLAPRRRLRHRLPQTARNAYRDLREIARARRYRQAALNGPWTSVDLAFVWQRHDIFQWAGFEAARKMGVPLVLFMDTLQVWEAEKWGVRRPGWGRLVERFGELPQVRAADLLACVSEEVAAEVESRGIPEAKILVTPCAVDLERFSPDGRSNGVRARLGLHDKFVIGWVGSFRRFHGLDILLDAVASVQREVPEAALLLVGDGLERPRLEQRARDLGLRNVVFVGTVSHSEMPQYINAMDVATLLASGDHEFHYSPLKLREYMACARPVVAARVGQVGRAVADGKEALLVDSIDGNTVATGIRALHDDRGLRNRLGRNARKRAMREASWDQQLARVSEALGERIGR
ncbi:MAG: glycosyltransferase family 4 protein [Actinomycetota bacterium]